MAQEFAEPEGPVEDVDYGQDAGPGSRSTGLTVMAILAWIFGGMAFCCLPISVVQAYFPISPGPQGNPMTEVYEQMPWIKTFTLVSALVGMLLSLVLVFGGVGLWKLRRFPNGAAGRAPNDGRESPPFPGAPRKPIMHIGT